MEPLINEVTQNMHWPLNTHWHHYLTQKCLLKVQLWNMQVSFKYVPKPTGMFSRYLVLAVSY